MADKRSPVGIDSNAAISAVSSAVADGRIASNLASRRSGMSSHLKSGITFESRDQRVKRAILMEPAELCARRIDEPLLEGFDQARLANARLTRQQHDLAVPALAHVQRRSRISISSSRPTS